MYAAIFPSKTDIIQTLLSVIKMGHQFQRPTFRAKFPKKYELSNMLSLLLTISNRVDKP